MSRITSSISKIFHTSPNITTQSLQSPLNPEPLAQKKGAYFPLRYLTDMFKFIDAHRRQLSVFTYDDMDLKDGRDHATSYKSEYDAWHQRIAADPQASEKAHLLFQYDIDRSTNCMHALLSAPEHDTVPANVMLFNERVDRWRLQSLGELGTTEYPLNDDLLRRRQSEGFVIGYHTNAYELGGHDTARALEVFDRDMTAMSEKYGVRFFSAHGGVPDANGKNNNTLPYHPDWIDRSVWVHNGINLRFDGVFSDGGHNSPKRDPAGRDLRRFFETMRPGKRYRMLLHPQYYGDDFGVSKRFVGTPWYDDMIRTARQQPDRSLWENVKLNIR